MAEKYYLRILDLPKVEVTKQEWVRAERGANFRGGRDGEPSTGGFSSGVLSGSIEYVKDDNEHTHPA